MTTTIRRGTEGTACFWRHRWAKWIDKSEGEVKNEGRVIGKIIIQERRCERCNQAELRKAQTNISVFA